jgi:glutaredoxin
MARVITARLRKISFSKRTTHHNYKENKMKAIVWSKDQCPYCDQAKNLLKMKGIEFEERNVSKDWTREQLLEAVPNARTVPQIFLGEELVGGFNELRQRLA